jgi:hypothetical protein
MNPVIVLWFLFCIAAAVLIIRGCSKGKHSGLDWFYVYPNLRPSKKARGRAQQRSVGRRR